VRYSNADIESWVSCVEFVDGGSEDDIASTQPNSVPHKASGGQREPK
jgi:hypothetical protein